MSQASDDLNVLLKGLNPVLHDGVYAYSVVAHDADLSAIPALATFREPEGLTVILAESDAVKANLPIHFRAAWITLTVHSDLRAVGLTAAVSRALSDAGISCNVIAAAHHDHLFVPLDARDEAMRQLRALQAQPSR